MKEKRILVSNFLARGQTCLESFYKMHFKPCFFIMLNTAENLNCQYIILKFTTNIYI